MRIKHLLALLCCCFIILTAQAQAKLTPNEQLSNKGIDFRAFRPLSFSPDGDTIAGIVRGTKKDIAAGRPYTLAICKLNRDLVVSRVSLHPLRIPHMGQACFTPDGKAVVITTKAGASILKVDVATGETTSIMQHVAGQPGFKCYPEVIVLSDGKMLISGYFYNGNDFAGHNSLAYLDPAKTGVDAFTQVSDIQAAQFAVRRDGESFYEVFPAKDLGFLAINNKKTCTFYKWTGKNKPTAIDKGLRNMAYWGAAHRLIYSIERAANNYDLIVYDAPTSKPITLAKHTATPYTNLYLSGDGKTAIANIENHGLTKVFFARESEGWKLKPLAEMPSAIEKGPMRLSADGSRLLLYNSAGIRVINVK